MSRGLSKNPANLFKFFFKSCAHALKLDKYIDRCNYQPMYLDTDSYYMALTDNKFTKIMHERKDKVKIVNMCLEARLEVEWRCGI